MASEASGAQKNAASADAVCAHGVIRRCWRQKSARLSQVRTVSGHLIGTVDAGLSRRLLRHQRVGIQFLARSFELGGGILADEMGLGKTLQAIAATELLVTAGRACRVLVVVPANLVKNWEGEFRRWAGKGGHTLIISTIIADDAALHARHKLAQLAAVCKPSHLVAIASFQVLERHGAALRESSGVDLMIIDEAHDLRNFGICAQAIDEVPSTARFVLSGTPISNRCRDFYTLATLARPELLGSEASFNANYVRPIAAAASPSATDDDIAIGEVASARLAAIAARIMLRRQSEVLARGLPGKHMAVLCCTPTPLQRELHAHVATTTALGDPMTRLGMLRKIHMHPPLLEGRGSVSLAGKSALRLFVPKVPEQPAECMNLSGKMQACARLLDAILFTTPDRIVVIANSIPVLALVGAYVRGRLGSPTCVDRIVGDVKLKARKATETSFNAPSSPVRVLLLSAQLAKGITLTGANHLIHLEPSWNPAVDEQALARIHRPGQTKPCWIYRLVLTGSMDETVLERQERKCSLLSTLDTGALPMQGSDDRALLFALDDDGGARLQRCARDSVYADVARWCSAHTGNEPAWMQLKVPWLHTAAASKLHAVHFIGKEQQRARGGAPAEASQESASSQETEEGAEEDPVIVPQHDLFEAGALPVVSLVLFSQQPAERLSGRCDQPVAGAPDADAQVALQQPAMAPPLLPATPEEDALSDASANDEGGLNFEWLERAQREAEKREAGKKRRKPSGSRLAHVSAAASVGLEAGVDVEDTVLEQLLEAERERVQGKAARCAAVTTEMYETMDTGVHVNHDLADAFGVPYV